MFQFRLDRIEVATQPQCMPPDLVPFLLAGGFSAADLVSTCEIAR